MFPDSTKLSAWLESRYGRPMPVQSMKRSTGGLSRETWFTRGDWGALTLRCDLESGVSACPVPLSFEYEIHRRLATTALPIADAPWFEADTSILGRQFYIREFIDGTPAPEGFDLPGPEGDEIRIAVSREHVRRMAEVHQTDWRKLALDELMPAPPSAEQSASATIDRLEATYFGLPGDVSPLMVLAFARLRDLAPTNAPAICLCKGSNGAMQEIWRDGQIVGLSDWELASLGDPVNDWARCQGFLPVVEGRWGPSEAFAFYTELTGYPVDAERLEFYRIVYLVEQVIVGRSAARPLLEGTLLDARLAFLATYPAKVSERRVGQALGILPRGDVRA